MTAITTFDSRLAALLPVTHAILAASNLVAHPSVSRVTLHGSRGLAGGFRPDSDVDLSLLVDAKTAPDREHLGSLLRAVLDTTLSQWRGPVELDVAAIFDTQDCGLRCFDVIAYDESHCAVGAIDCFGLYKLQKGFNGFVTNAGIDVRRMYPCLRIWQRA